MDAAQRLERDVIVTALTLAELYRGPHHNQLVDACLSRETGLDVRRCPRGGPAVEKGGGVVLTGDEDDLGRLAATYPNVLVQGV